MKKKISTLVVIITLPIFFVWLAMFRNSSTNEIVKENKPVIDYAPLSFPNNTIDTSDWETYRNEEFGFEVKYPKEFLVKSTSANQLDSSENLGASFMGHVAINDPKDLYSEFLIFFYRESINQTIERRLVFQFKDPAEGKSLPSSKKIVLNNLTMVYFEDQETQQTLNGQYFLGDEHHGYEVHHTTGDNNASIFKEMLSLFKLIK